MVSERECEIQLLDPRIAAGAKIAHFPGGEAVRRHTGKERAAKERATSDWRARLVPAAAVIPASKVSVVFVVIKRSAVGQRGRGESKQIKRRAKHGKNASRGAGGGRRIWQPEVKFGDLPRTDRGEGACQGRFH